MWAPALLSGTFNVDTDFKVEVKARESIKQAGDVRLVARLATTDHVSVETDTESGCQPGGMYSTCTLAGCAAHVPNGPSRVRDCRSVVATVGFHHRH